ncbi:S24 family peptidase [Billgrantia gudaonensis]|uniref:Phage repressor protein C, contains Cro/C1-type HTH and peptisase s24 domains n=1 Tax=Billgrantia gudaonensis TaxID=376427 RepID=A0A1G9ATD2_9GAMM|nr:S24 family peptidase [Halomonas gudaonensis]SDK30562.1 Phage repressor protein C, contains Cro/C1-type HTH and peptisase s24 domains [Halomonas gudaonensis]
MTYGDSDANPTRVEEHPFPLERIGCFKDRLSEVKSAHSLRGFSKLCGLSEATLRSYLSGDTYPTLDRLFQIAQAAQVEPGWLAFGDEPQAHPAGSVGEAAVSYANGDYAFVPLYDAQCSAGDGAWNENCRVLTHLAFTRYSLRKQGLTPEHLSAIRVDGDSMEPVLEAGDTVLIDHTRTHIEGEGIYIIRLDDHLYAKRLQRSFDGVAVISENPSYERITVPRDRLQELEIIGRAVWAAGWL